MTLHDVHIPQRQHPDHGVVMPLLFSVAAIAVFGVLFLTSSS
jgi:hypothetical protein